MLLSLQTPVGPNFLKDYPDQNSVNCDAFDEYAGPCLATHPIQSYTPILASSGTQPLLGTGADFVMRGMFYEVFDQIYTWGEFRFGTGGAVGTGTYFVTLPFRAKSLVGTGSPSAFASVPVVGNALAFDESADATRQPMLTVLRTVDHLAFLVRFGTAGASRGMGQNIPFAFTGAPAPADGVMWCARYQREA